MPTIIPYAEPAAVTAAAAHWGPGDEPVFFLRNQDEETFRAKAARVQALAVDFDGTLSTNTFREIEHRLPLLARARGRRTLDSHVDFASRARRGSPPPKNATFRDRIEYDGAESEIEEATSESGLLAHGVIAWMRAGLTRAMLEEIARKMLPRRGAMKLCAALPIGAVVSGGVEPVIQSFLGYHGFPPSLEVIGGICPLFDEEGRIEGLHHNVWPSTLKGALIRRLRAYWRMEREGVLCVGDTPFDAVMMREAGLAIGLMPPKAEDALAFEDRLARFPAYWEAADALLIGDSLLPIAELIRETRPPACA